MIRQAGARNVVVHTPEPGAGAGQYVAEFVVGLAAQGARVRLFCPSNFSYTKEVSAAGVEVVRAPAREVGYASLWHRLSRNVMFAIRALRQFWPSVKRDDVVHFQFVLPLGLGILFLAAARLKGAWVVMTVHDPLPHRWILPSALRWLETAFLSIGYSFCNQLIVHNQAGRKILVEQFQLDAGSVSVIPHGPLNAAPKAVDAAATKTAGSEPLKLLAFGSLRENKGLHLAIGAVQHLRRSGGGRPICLTIAGQIPNLMERGYWESCGRMIRQDPAGIELLERVIEDDEIGPLFARHDAVLLPYGQFFSDSGVAMLALSQRRPIVATSAGGLGELLAAVDCGVLIESATLEGVTAAIEKIRYAPVEWLQRKGRNGCDYALNGRSWNAIAQKTLQLYGRSLKSAAKVVLHTPEPASSAALYIEALAKALVAEDVPVSIVCPANHQAIATLSQENAIEIHKSCERGTSTRVSLFNKVWENLRFVVSSAWTLLQATKPRDIVHFQYILHLPFGLIFFVCARMKRAHIVFTVHDPLPHKFLFPRTLRWIEMAGLRWAYRWSDVLIVHSEAGQRTLTEAFHISPAKIQVIVHGPYELGHRVQRCSEKKRLEVLFFGSLRENKAPHLAIQAVQQMAKQGVAIRLTIAGQVVNRKEEAYWARCRTLIDPQSGAVNLIEQFIPDQELPQLFSNCHCFLLPYTNFSSDSGVAYMAIANRKPIVSTGAGGLGWLLEQSQGGIAIAEANVEEVMAALHLAVDAGPERMEQMGRAGAEWLLANCGWKRVAGETREVYAKWLPEVLPEAESGRALTTPDAVVEVLP